MTIYAFSLAFFSWQRERLRRGTALNVMFHSVRVR